VKQRTLGKRQLAKAWNCDERTISRYLKAGMPHKGSRLTLTFDVERCQAWRNANIAQRMPKLTARRSQTTEPNVRRCTGCGYVFRVDTATTVGRSPDPRHFCSDDCSRDVEAGLDRNEIRGRIWAWAKTDGASKKELQDPGLGDWAGPQFRHRDCYCSEADYALACEHPLE